LQDAPDGTLVRFSFQAIGAIDPAMIEGMTSGWTTLVASRLKALVETGSPEREVEESNMRVIGDRRATPGGSGSPRRRR
jgi:hypothetical protein